MIPQVEHLVHVEIEVLPLCSVSTCTALVESLNWNPEVSLKTSVALITGASSGMKDPPYAQRRRKREALMGCRNPGNR